MFPFLRRALVGTAALALSLSSFAVDTANAYPDQPIKIIVTFPPGGSADIVIRALQPVVSETLRQTDHHREQGGSGRQYRHRGRGEVRARRLHARRRRGRRAHRQSAPQSGDDAIRSVQGSDAGDDAGGNPVRAGGFAAVGHYLGQGSHRKGQGRTRRAFRSAMAATAPRCI